MAKHEFGIMQSPPEKGLRFDKYEPHKYNCISVDDNLLQKVAGKFNDLDFCWHTADVLSKGLAYEGITLIPPSSMEDFKNAIESVSALSELNDLITTALAQNKWMIHFGI